MGSPLVALGVYPQFDEYHFIDLDGEKVDFLRGQVGNRPDVTFYNADSNQVMLESVLPRFSYAKWPRLGWGEPLALGEFESARTDRADWANREGEEGGRKMDASSLRDERDGSDSRDKRNGGGAGVLDRVT